MKFFLCFIFSYITTVSFAQNSISDTIIAVFSDEKISLDGKLEEPIWEKSDKISNFTQTEPEIGKPASEKTQVAVVYSSSALFFAAWCYQDSAYISAKSLQRDFDYDAYEIYEGMVRIYGTLDDVRAQFIRNKIEEAGFHPLLFSCDRRYGYKYFSSTGNFQV